MAERMLKGGTDIDGSVEIVSNEQFNLSNRATEDLVDRGLVNGFVSSYDGLVRTGSSCG